MKPSPTTFAIIYKGGHVVSAKATTAFEAIAANEHPAFGHPIGVLPMSLIVTPADGTEPLLFVPFFASLPTQQPGHE